MAKKNSNIHILIVDDDLSIRNTMQEYINNAGYASLTASTAEEALDLVKKNNFTVVVTDIRLPGMGGLELTKVIKKDNGADVIVVTGYSDDYSYEEAINVGASDFVIKPVRLEELLLRLKRVLKERKLGTERTRMMEKLQKLAITDGLTKLYNSRSFYTQLELEVDRFNRYKHPLSLLLLDIDNFKEYNDSYGHLEGDKVLVRFSQIIKSCLRANDSAYRYGGEEFTVILPETTGDEAKTVAQRIRSSLEAEKYTPAPGKVARITISIGVTQCYPKEELSTFIRRADKAMYLSKQNGRNRVSILLAEPPVKSKLKA
ncbi:MAG: diguanylate cyclase [Desulfobacterales bacterium]|jgi:diguanylate cyclase (GGDEF)-like protein|nr:diguanylate cyclase [Desulfobacterales bacterium]MCK5202844.1 diguanylate cyclase [Desulfobacterales bacterium]